MLKELKLKFTACILMCKANLYVPRKCEPLTLVVCKFASTYVSVSARALHAHEMHGWTQHCKQPMATLLLARYVKAQALI